MSTDPHLEGLREATEVHHYNIGCTDSRGRKCPVCRGDVLAVLAAYLRGSNRAEAEASR